MRKIFLFILITMSTIASFSQKLNPTQSLIKQDYLSKSKTQKKVGWILLGGGTALMATGFLIPKGEFEGYDICPQIICETYKNDEIKSAFILAGVVSMVGSIPLFILSGKNKRKANKTALNASPYLRMEKALILSSSGIEKDQYPSIGVKINIH